MEILKSKKRVSNLLMAGVFLLLSLGSSQPASAQSKSWEQIDREVKSKIFHLNVGMKIRLKDGSYATLNDMSPKYKMPVFASSQSDMGYRVVGFGTTFPITQDNKGTTYFITNHHVVNSHYVIVQSCQKKLQYSAC